jgi:hypothetical protein
MRRKCFLVGGVLVLVLIGVLASLAALVLYVPPFYREKEVDAGDLRSHQSQAFETSFTGLISAIINDRRSWQATFTEAQINSFLAEDFVSNGYARGILPDGVSEPRVAIDHDVVHLGFRYGRQPWSTVMSVDLRVWMAPNESNVVLLQILGIRAGALPISSKVLMEKVADSLRNQYKDLEINWYRHEGQVTALMRFSSGRPRAQQLQKLQIGQGLLHIEGGAPQDSPTAACPNRGH